MEKTAQMFKNDQLQVTAISLSIEKSFEHKTKKNLLKVEKPEQIPIIIDYTKLHKHYLKLSKIKLTCMYIYVYKLCRNIFEICMNINIVNDIIINFCIIILKKQI